MIEDERKTTTLTIKPQESLRPPDGGWGWVVVFGSSLCHIFHIPILQNFTFIFKDRFTELDFTSTEITTIVSLNSSFGMILGLLNGPLLKLYGYRKTAFAGLTLYMIGILCTGIASSYIEFVIFYGLLASIGTAMIFASFSLALSSYFLKKRSKAFSYTTTLTGLGPVFMPYAISYLLSSYGLKWTVFLLSGLNLHGYIGVFLLQPVKWHMKVQKQDSQPQEKEENKIVLSDVHSFLEMSVWGSRMSLPTYSADLPLKSRKAHSRELLQVKEERNKPRKLSVTFLDNDDYKNMMNSTLHMIERMDIWESNVKYASVETLSLENEELLKDNQKNLTDPNSKFEGNECDVDKVKEIQGSPENVKSGLFIRFIRYLKDLYDLDLLRDFFYVNLLLGLSVAFAGEIMFSTMTPIMLKEIGFGTEDIATFMSVIAGCDLLCRFIAPFVEKKLKFNSRKMYIMALLMLLVCRFGLLLATTYNTCLLVSFGLGVGKGFRSVYWILVLPDNVPLLKLPSASALQSVINGILILLAGPAMGVIITWTKSYLSIIVASNILSLTTVLLWSGEIIYLKYKKKG